MVAKGIETFREHEDMNDVPLQDRLFAHSKAIEELFSLLDKSFDVMNGECPKKGIYREKLDSIWKECKHDQFKLCHICTSE